MRITQLWRYPVKSLQGETLESVDVDACGLVGDRRWALFDAGTDRGLTGRRLPELLSATGVHHDDDTVSIRLPDGTETADDDVLSRWLGRDVVLRSAHEQTTPPVYETVTDPDDEATSSWESWQGPLGVFHDSSRTQVSLCAESTATAIAPLDEVRRFRFNVVLSGAGTSGGGSSGGEEDALVGSSVRLGADVELRVLKRIGRCVVVTRPQPGGIDRDLGVLKAINASREGCLGIGALVRTPGSLAVGDELHPT